MRRLINQFDEPYQIQPGERIAQLAVLPILCPVIEAVDTLTQTQRGAGALAPPADKPERVMCPILITLYEHLFYHIGFILIFHSIGDGL